MKELIEQKLKMFFPDADIEIHGADHEGNHVHVQVNIASTKFSGLSLVEQHRLVNEALQDFLKNGTVHALKIKTRLKGE